MRTGKIPAAGDRGAASGRTAPAQCCSPTGGEPAGRWVEGISPDDPAAEVAVRLLRDRLGRVQQYLPPAADRADEDLEHVHRLRVWTRRATAALRLFEELLPRRRLGWMKKQLRRIRRAANEARDCDVLIARLEAGRPRAAARRWLEAVRDERAEAQGAIVAVRARLTRDDRFARRIDELLKRIRPRGREEAPPADARFGDWAPARLRPLVERFLAAAPRDEADEAALHRFRIRGKELRYAMELTAPAFPADFRTGLYPIIEEVKDRLGAINDRATARTRLLRCVENARDAKDADRFRRLLAGEQEQLDRLSREFREWCRMPRIDELRDRFDAALAGSGPGSPDPPPDTMRRQESPSAPPDGDPTATGAGSPRDGRATPKGKIVGELGEQELLLPALVNEALAANDRAKYLMTLLQAARQRADHPDLAVTDLRPERLAAGVADPSLDAVVALSRKADDATYQIPGVRRIHDRLVEEVRRMLEPLRAGAAPAPPDGRGPSAGFRERLDAWAAAPPPEEDRILGEAIDRITSGRREAGDSLHLLIMDLHKELNRLQQQLATERNDGACVYGIGEEDRPLIAAFMAGVNRTRGLKFEHPGLGTTATRSGQRLVIQNDIGLTEAHVLVIHVEDERVTITYTDVHFERLVFFQELFSRFAVRWEDPVSKRASALGAEMYHLGLGTYRAKDRADLGAFLDFLGSRLVFLIDWNRARKRLRRFAPRRVCLEVLRWAADRDIGHMGFLTLGGERLVFDALQAAGPLPIPPGGQLSDVLGPERVGEFLRFTLRAASEGLRQGRSEFLIRDEISAELRHYIDTAHQGFLRVAAEHASLIVELATAARDILLATGPADDPDRLRRTVERARTWEHRADVLVGRGRMAGRGEGHGGPIRDLLVTADDVADGLEDALFRLSLLLSSPSRPERSAPLGELAGLVVQGAQEYLKAVEGARQLHRGSPREHVADFLEAVDRVMTVEHQADDAHRHAQAEILGFPGDFRQWLLFAAVADKLEGAADALMRSALLLRDDVLGEVLRR